MAIALIGATQFCQCKFRLMFWHKTFYSVDDDEPMSLGGENGFYITNRRTNICIVNHTFMALSSLTIKKLFECKICLRRRRIEFQFKCGTHTRSVKQGGPLLAIWLPSLWPSAYIALLIFHTLLPNEMKIEFSYYAMRASSRPLAPRPSHSSSPESTF